MIIAAKMNENNDKSANWTRTRRRGRQGAKIENMTNLLPVLGLLYGASLARADYQASSHSQRQNQRKVFIPPPQSIIADEAYRHQAVKRFHLGEHLSRPRVRHLSDDSEDLKRLKRNSERLGRGRKLVDDDGESLGAANPQNERDLGAANPPSKLFTEFQWTPLPSQGPRVSLNGHVDPLPFGDGPGVKPLLPKANADFWTGSGHPTSMWEATLCPVTDVAAFLSDPLRCIFGDGGGTIITFMTDLAGDPDALTTAMSKAVIPLAADAIWTFTGLGSLEILFGQICDILGFVDPIYNIVEDIIGIVNSVLDFVSFGALRRKLVDKTPADSDDVVSCQGHLATCSGPTDECNVCLVEDGADCRGCRTCYQPDHLMFGDLDGVCMPTIELRDFLTGPANLVILQDIHSQMLAQYMKKQVREAAEENSLSADRLMAELQASLEVVGNIITSSIDTTRNHIFEKIDDTCPAPSTGRRLDRDPSTSADSNDEAAKIHSFLRSKNANEARRVAKETLGDGVDFDMIATKVMDTFSSDNVNKVVGSKVSEQINSALTDPQVRQFVDKMVDTELNRPGQAGALAARLLQESVSPNTNRLDTASLNDTLEKLKAIREAGKVDHKHRALGLKDDCYGVLDTVKSFIKDDVITPALEYLVNGAVDYMDVDDKYGDMPGGSALTIPFTFMSALDVFPARASHSGRTLSNSTPVGGVLSMMLELGITSLQHILSIFLFGCVNPDGSDSSCGVLPSLKNEVIRVKQTRNGEAYLSTGCDGDFEAELIWYPQITKVMKALLEGAGDTILPPFNFPVNVVKIIFQVVEIMFGQLYESCEMIDDFVELAFIEATYENSRFALQELACRQPVELARGHGCDGIDNTCDPNKVIDECNEDIIPALQRCEDTIFASAEDAVACFDRPGLIVAEDDCQDVNISVVHSNAKACSADIVIKATAQRCHDQRPAGADPHPDITTRTVTVQIDDNNPSVTVGFERENDATHQAAKYLHLKQTKYDFENIGLHYTVNDSCAGRDVKVDLTVSSNEFSFANSKTDENMALLRKRKDKRQSHQLVAYIEPVYCERNPMKGAIHPKPLCDFDLDTSPFRFYQFDLTATDAAGNVGSDTMWAIILHDGYSEMFSSFPGYSKSDFFVNMTDATPPQNIIASIEPSWLAGDTPTVWVTLSAFLNGLELSPAQVDTFVADFESNVMALLGDKALKVIVDKIGGIDNFSNPQEGVTGRRIQRQQRRRVDQATEVTFRVQVPSRSDDTTVEIVDEFSERLNSGALDLNDSGFGAVSMDSTQVQDIDTVAGNNVVHTQSIPAGVFYPSWSGDDITCYNDTDYPAYMNSMEWFEDSLEHCCERHYIGTYHQCMNETTGWYPTWHQFGNHNASCSNDKSIIPDYMNDLVSIWNSVWQKETIEECCQEWYGHDLDGCIVNSGGKYAESADNWWYVVHTEQICVQNCLRETSELQGGDQGLHCGGLARSYDETYATREECCSEKLNWIALDVCASESIPIDAIGTLKWYVDFQNEKCHQDCSNESEFDDPHCGGIVEDNWAPLFNTVHECCLGMLKWVDNCHEKSIIV